MLQHQTATLVVAVGTLVLTVLLYIIVPKGFFPIQDTGAHPGDIGSAPVDLVPGHGRAAAGPCRGDPERPGSREPLLLHRCGRHQHHPQQRAHTHQPEAPGRAGRNASEVIRRLQPELAKVDGITLFMQPVQDLTVDARVSRTQFQYTLEDPDFDELNSWSPKLVNVAPHPSRAAVT